MLEILWFALLYNGCLFSSFHDDMLGLANSHIRFVCLCVCICWRLSGFPHAFDTMTISISASSEISVSGHNSSTLWRAEKDPSLCREKWRWRRVGQVEGLHRHQSTALTKQRRITFSATFATPIWVYKIGGMECLIASGKKVSYYLQIILRWWKEHSNCMLWKAPLMSFREPSIKFNKLAMEHTLVPHKPEWQWAIEVIFYFPSDEHSSYLRAKDNRVPITMINLC